MEKRLDNAVVIRIKEKVYLWYNTVEFPNWNNNIPDKRAMLLDNKGNKVNRNPLVSTLVPLHVIPGKQYYSRWYVKTKIGIISLSTGNLTTNPRIDQLFYGEEPKTDSICFTPKGRRKRCSKCRASVKWVRHEGKWRLQNPNGSLHYCPTGD